jgi:steroid 5-alpha reductase family enzyme
MIDWQIFTSGLMAIAVFALFGWLISLVRNNVTHVDSMWSLFLAIGAYAYFFNFHDTSPRSSLILTLVSIWAIRLCVYLTWRNWNPHEDHRYAAIRKNNQPNFWLSSIYIVFGLQAVLAWIISAPLFGAMVSKQAINFIDVIGILLFTFGFLWETLADMQLAKFKAQLSNKGKVLNTGLWRFSRHPNYFGECCVWWGFYLIAFAGGAWWTIISPILMTLLLLKISGVALLEKDIAERRPAYADYVKNTNAFVPGRPK